MQAKSEELVTVQLQQRERTSTLERAVANAQREKAVAEAQAQRYLEEMRAGQGPADWQAKKEQLEADLANHVQRAANEQSRRMQMAQTSRRLTAMWSQSCGPPSSDPRPPPL